MSSVHVPAIAPGEPAPCHPDRLLSGTGARCWCRGCGATCQACPAEIVPSDPHGPGAVLAREQRVARAAAARAHELELERAQHVPEYRWGRR